MKSRPLVVGLSLLSVAGVIAWSIIHASSFEPPSTGTEQSAAGGKKADADQDNGEEAGAKVTLTEVQLKNAQLGIATAGPEKIKRILPLSGRIEVNEEHMERVVPRFPGIVRGVRKRLGEKVEQGEVLATIESNGSMRTYDIVSEIAGTVIQKELTAGEFVRDDKSDFYHRRSQHGMGGLERLSTGFSLVARRLVGIRAARRRR